jgi:hypothetical protein
MLFALAPNARFGYFAYPAALLGWLALTARRASFATARQKFRRGDQGGGADPGHGAGTPAAGWG